MDFEATFSLDWNKGATQRGHLTSIDKANIAAQKHTSPGTSNKDILIKVLGAERYAKIASESKYFEKYPGSLMNNIKNFTLSEFERAITLSKAGKNPMEDESISILVKAGVFKRKATK